MLIWLKTRDGSSTLWDNELSEPYRSLRGAFTESFEAYVAPMLDHIDEINIKGTLNIGEFGLGPGTNFILSQAFLQALCPDLKINYFVVERNPNIFLESMDHWKQEETQISEFVMSKTGIDKSFSTSSFEDPTILADFDSFIAQETPLLDVWYHDPFGIDVNPEGYHAELFQALYPKLNSNVIGLSYACNRKFKSSLEKANFEHQTPKMVARHMNRDRIEFFKAQASDSTST